MDQLMKLGEKAFRGNDNEAHGFSTNPLTLMKQFDRDNDGSITEEDFILVLNDIGLGHIGEPVVKAAFKKIDKNQNGKIDMSEAYKLLKEFSKLLKISEGQ